MKKLMSVVLLLLNFFSNFFYFTFADDVESPPPDIPVEISESDDFWSDEWIWDWQDTENYENLDEVDVEDTSFGTETTDNQWNDTINGNSTDNWLNWQLIDITTQWWENIDLDVEDEVWDNDADLTNENESDNTENDSLNTENTSENEDTNENNSNEWGDADDLDSTENNDSGVEDDNDNNTDDGENTDNIDTEWDEDIWEQLPNLFISEIFFGSKNEWIEIYNAGWDFAGEISISWASANAKSFSISIPNEWIIILKDSSVTTIIDESMVVYDNAAFNMTDTVAINVKLLFSGNVLDTFVVPQDIVSHTNSKVSFQRFLDTRNITGTTTDFVYNMSEWYFANPWIIYNEPTNTGSTINTGDIPDIPTLIDTWDYELPISCEDFVASNIANISEVFFGNSTYPSYVELNVSESFSSFGQVFLSWSAVSNTVYFDTVWLDSQPYVLLTPSSIWYDKWRNATQNNNFQLNSSWWLLLYGWSSENPTLLDIIYISNSSAGNSVYIWSEYIECAWFFDHTDKFSPWLTMWQSNFIQITPDPIIKYVQVNNWWNCPNNNESNDNSNAFNTSSNLSNEIQISSIKYHWSNQILKLKNKTNYDINLHEYEIQTLNGQTYAIQWNTLSAKTTMSFLWSYNIPNNADFCVNLIKNGNVVDRYCRNSLSKASDTERDEVSNNEWWIINNWETDWNDDWQDDEDDTISENNENQTTGSNNQTYLIKILDIDYDPAWADGDNESITLRLLTEWQINLSWYTLYYTKDGKTQKAKAQIQWILSYGNSQIFKWWFTFPNSTTDKKDVVVNLKDTDGNIVATYMYNPNKITEIPAWNYDVLSVVDGDTIKISYASQEFSVRLAGIDAPESSSLRCGKVECFGPEAKQYLTSLVGWKTIKFEPASMDSFDRFVWYIFLNWENINEKVIKNGYAWEYSYKDQSYEYQSLFKSAQDYAKNHSLWLRWAQCKWQRLCPVQETQIKDNYIFNIEKVIYDPEWADDGKEEIWITMIQWFTVEFGTDFYLLVNDTKKSLKKYGNISPWDTKKLVWTFGFPNNKLTTISLVYDGVVLDSFTYDPEKDKKEQEQNTWDNILSNFGEIKIMSILPNPFWADWANEEISIYYAWQEPELNLSGFFLRVWTTKKKLSGNLVSEKETLLKWKFSFPNKWSCVEIWYWSQIFDKFCYTQPKDGQRFYISNGVLESVSTQDLSILKNSKLQNIWNKVCLTYQGQSFYCKNMPYSKLSKKRINQNKMYKEFFDSFEDYMKEKWKIMYYDSEIRNYFDLLNEIEDAISAGKSVVNIEWIQYQISEFKKMYAAKYQKDPKTFLFEQINNLLPAWLTDKYNSLKTEYELYLFQKNPPDI